MSELQSGPPVSNSAANLSASLNMSQAATWLWQQQLQSGGYRYGGHNSHRTALEFLQQQENQLRATRMFLQQRQLNGLLSPRGSVLGLAGDRSSALASLSSATKLWDEVAKEEPEKEDDHKDEEEKESLSDEEYFKDFSTKDSSSEQEGDAEDGKVNSESFPHKLYRMLYEAEHEGNENIVSFLPSGRGFAIHDSKKFMNQVMNRYFTTRRVASFQRQLNLYGFRRISEGKEKGGYFHKSFAKGERSLLKKIRRKSTTSRPSASVLYASSLSNLAPGAAGAPSSLHFSTNPNDPSSFLGNAGFAGSSNSTNATKELLLASVANNGNTNNNSNNVGTGSLLEMARQGYLATQHAAGGSSHQEILRNAASLLWGNRNGSSSFF